MSKRAEELAVSVYKKLTMQDDAETRQWLTMLFKQYGQEVREAAAIRGRITQMEGGLVDNAIRDMPLP